MITHYINEENIFVDIVSTLSLQKKYQNVILKITLKLMENKRFKMLKKGEYVKFKHFERKKITIYDLCRFRRYSKV